MKNPIFDKFWQCCKIKATVNSLSFYKIVTIVRSPN